MRDLPNKVPVPPELSPFSPKAEKPCFAGAGKRAFAACESDSEDDNVHHNRMDIDLSMHDENNYRAQLFFDELKKTNSTCGSIPLSLDLSEMEGLSSDHPSSSRTDCTSQDAGYCTNSLQSTNQDTGTYSHLTGQLQDQESWHTNLTTQFGALPLLSQDTGIEYSYTGDSNDGFGNGNHQALPIAIRQSESKFIPTEIDTPRVDNSKFMSCQRQEGTGKLNEKEVVRKARLVLGMSEDAQHSTDVSSFMHTSESTPGKESSDYGVPMFPWRSSTPQKHQPLKQLPHAKMLYPS